MGCFLVARFQLTSASRGFSAIAELLVAHMKGAKQTKCNAKYVDVLTLVCRNETLLSGTTARINAATLIQKNVVFRAEKRSGSPDIGRIVLQLMLRPPLANN